LLSTKHREGRSKAEFFAQLGFSSDAWEDLVKALLRHAAENEVAKIEDSPFGTRYIIEGVLLARTEEGLGFDRYGSLRRESRFRGSSLHTHCRGGSNG